MLIIFVLLLIFFLTINGGNPPVAHFIEWPFSKWMPMVPEFLKWVPKEEELRKKLEIMRQNSKKTYIELYVTLPLIIKLQYMNSLIELERIYNNHMPPVRTVFENNFPYSDGPICVKPVTFLPLGLSLGEIPKINEHQLDIEFRSFFIQYNSHGYSLIKTSKGVEQIVLDPSSKINISFNRVQYMQLFSTQFERLKEYKNIQKLCVDFYKIIKKHSPYVADTNVSFARYDYGCGIRSHFDCIVNNNSDIYVINLFADYYYDMFPVLTNESKNGIRVLFKKNSYIRIASSARYEWTHGMPDLIPSKQQRCCIIFKCRSAHPEVYGKGPGDFFVLKLKTSDWFKYRDDFVALVKIRNGSECVAGHLRAANKFSNKLEKFIGNTYQSPVHSALEKDKLIINSFDEYCSMADKEKYPNLLKCFTEYFNELAIQINNNNIAGSEINTFPIKGIIGRATEEPPDFTNRVYQGLRIGIENVFYISGDNIFCDFFPVFKHSSAAAYRLRLKKNTLYTLNEEARYEYAHSFFILSNSSYIKVPRE